MQIVRLFISSPGDVAEERDRARQVIESLRRRYAARFLLKPVLWEDLPLQADLSFQQGIDLVLSAEHGLDIAVFILWSRMGSLQEDSAHRSGTEREFDLMLAARRQSGDLRPALLVYTRSDDTSFTERLRGRSTPEQQDLIAQKALVEQFISEKFQDSSTGRNVRAHHTFDRPVTFSQRLRVHLTELLDEMAGGGITEAAWDIAKHGPPFLGLEAFQPRHADVFFGREDEILEVRHALREQARDGCSFVLLSGASGSGKSSLARAGVLPAIVGNELDEQVAAWLPVIVTPSELAPDPIDSLVRLLAADDLLPGLRGDEGSLDDFADVLRRNPADAFKLRIKPTLTRAAQRAGGGVRLLLVLDQLEELFASAAIAAESRTAFLTVIETLARSGSVWVIATARSDFNPQLQTEPTLVRLKAGLGTVDVLPPATDALRRLIEEPARLAGLHFERRDGHALSDRILRDAASHPELLPLAEYVLRELFEKRTKEGRLTFSVYEQLGGVEGALARRAEAVFTGLPGDAQECLALVLKSLVTLGQDSGTAAALDTDEERPVRQRAPLSQFPPSTPARVLVDAFVRERLFTTAAHPQSGEASLTLAHESLLRAWPRAVQWATNNRDFLRARLSLRTALTSWRQEKTHPADLLLPKGKPLEDARALLHLHAAGLLTEEKEFICLSAAHHEAAERKRMTLRWFAMAGLTLGLFSLLGGILAFTQRREAEAQREQVKAALTEAKVQLERSQLEEGRAWFERARTAKEKGDHFAAIMLAGRAIGFHGCGRRDQETPAFEEQFQDLLGTPMMEDAKNEKQRSVEVGQAREFISSLHPTGLPIWSSPVNAHHSDVVTSVAFSPDGTRAASGSMDRMVRLWNVASGEEIFTLEGHTGGVTSVVFSTDGRKVASGSSDGTVKLWDSTTGTEFANLAGHTDGVTSVAFSADGVRLASGSWDKTIKLWDATTGRELATFAGHTDVVSSLSFNADGSQLASGSWDKVVKLWNVLAGTELATLKGHTAGVTSLDLSTDGARVISGSLDGTIRIWDAPTCKHLVTLKGHSDGVTSVDLAADGTRIASASSDMTVKLWDVVSGKQMATLKGHFEEATSVAFSPDGTRVVSGAADRTVRLWDATSGRLLTTPEGHSVPVTRVAFSADGTRVASASLDNTIKLWDTATGTELVTLVGHTGGVTGLALSPDGTRVASGALDRTVRLWDATSGRETATLEGHVGGVTSVAFSADGTHLASGSWDNTIKLWDVASSRLLTTLSGHTDVVSDVAFSPDTQRLASASWDNTITLWDAASGKELSSLVGHIGEATSVAFSADGTQVASASLDKTIKLWSTSSGKELATLTGHSNGVTSVAFSPDGARIASGADDSTIILWDATSSTELVSLDGHTDSVASVVFSPDGTQVASGSSDKTIKLWDVASGTEPVSLDGHRSQGGSLAFSADRARMASGSREGTIKLWDAVSGKELATLVGHSSSITSMAFSADDARLASGSWDNTVKLWDVASGRLLTTLPGHGDTITKVGFSPDGTQVASESEKGTVKRWDAVTGRHIPGATAPSLHCNTPPDGRFYAHIAGDVIHLEHAEPQPQVDLLAQMRQGLFKLPGRQVVWSTSHSLLHSAAFVPVHYRKDELAALAHPDLTETDRLQLRLRLLARTGQWRAAMAQWRQASGKSSQSAEVRRRYLALLAQTLHNDVVTPAAAREIVREVSKHLHGEDMGDSLISLPLAQALPIMASRTELVTDEMLHSLEHQLLVAAKPSWLLAVAEAAEKWGQDAGLPAEGSDRLKTLAETFRRGAQAK